MTGIVGEIDEGGDGFYIWTHKKFDIGYNEKQIVDVNLTSEAKVKLAPNMKISFTYEVSIVLPYYLLQSAVHSIFPPTLNTFPYSIYYN